MVSLVWQFAVFLFGLLTAGWLLFVTVAVFVALVRTIAKYIKKS